VVCGYELKGLSISSVCPECGTAVRATILYAVDPEAEEFQPLWTPRLTSLCLVVMPVGVLVAAVASWGMRVHDAVMVLASRGGSAAVWGYPVMTGGLLLGAVSCAGFVRPVRSTPWWKSAATLGATACFAVLIWSVLALRAVDTPRAAPYFGPRVYQDRVLVHALATVCTALILAGLRPVARDLVRRSLAMRTKRVDRQTILGMIGAWGLALVGDVLRWWGAGDQPTALAVGTLLVAVGSLFLTLGLASAIVDGWRIARAIRSPAPGLRQVVGGHA